MPSFSGPSDSDLRSANVVSASGAASTAASGSGAAVATAIAASGATTSASAAGATDALGCGVAIGAAVGRHAAAAQTTAASHDRTLRMSRNDRPGRIIPRVRPRPRVYPQCLVETLPAHPSLDRCDHERAPLPGQVELDLVVHALAEQRATQRRRQRDHLNAAGEDGASAVG